MCENELPTKSYVKAFESYRITDIQTERLRPKPIHTPSKLYTTPWLAKYSAQAVTAQHTK